MFMYQGDQPDHYCVEYLDQIMYASKEDCHATVQALALGILSFVAEHPDKDWCFVKTDGASCYSTGQFLRGLATISDLTGMQVRGHYLGEPGKNKTELDGHFGVKGAQVRRKVIGAKGKLDITSSTTLAKVVDAVASTGCKTQLFEPSNDHVAFEDPLSIQNLSFIADRSYVYEESTGKLSHVLLRHQYGLGDGTKLSREDVLGKNYDPSNLPQARLLYESTEKTGSRPLITGDAKKKATEEKAQKSGQLAEKRRAKKRHGRDAILELTTPLHVKSMAARPGKRKRGIYVCALDPRGNPDCSATYANPLCYEKHIKGKKHIRGCIGCASNRSRTNVAEGGVKLHDQMIHAIGAKFGQKRTIPGSQQVECTRPSLLAVPDLKLIDGTPYVPKERTAGWACSTRLPITKLSKAQLIFITECYKVGVQDKARKLKPADAVALMTELGTNNAEIKQPNNPYFAADAENTPRFSRLDILDESILKAKFGVKLSDLEAAVANFDSRRKNLISKAIGAFIEINARLPAGTLPQLQLVHVTAVLAYFQTDFGKVTRVTRLSAISLMLDELRKRELLSVDSVSRLVARLKSDNQVLESASDSTTSACPPSASHDTPSTASATSTCQVAPVPVTAPCTHTPSRRSASPPRDLCAVSSHPYQVVPNREYPPSPRNPTKKRGSDHVGAELAADCGPCHPQFMAPYPIYHTPSPAPVQRSMNTYPPATPVAGLFPCVIPGNKPLASEPPYSNQYHRYSTTSSFLSQSSCSSNPLQAQSLEYPNHIGFSPQSRVPSYTIGYPQPFTPPAPHIAAEDFRTMERNISFMHRR